MGSQANDIDVLCDVKNLFYVGNYQQCINEAQKIKPTTSEVTSERDSYLYRAYIAQRKFRVVLDEIGNSSSNNLKPLKMLADYFANPSNRLAILTELDKEVNRNDDYTSNLSFIIAAATIYYYEKNFESALQVLRFIEDLECRAMMLKIYLNMDRLDLAQKELKNMQDKDEDSTITQLAHAWLNICSGGEKLQDAYYILQEMIDKHSNTTILLNGQANCYIGQEKYEEAETVLQESLNKDSNDPDTLINLVVLAQHVGKPPEFVNRYLSQLKDSHKEHPFIREYEQKEEEFQKLARLYSTSM